MVRKKQLLDDLSEAGQSLIETIVAIFVLTTALTSGLGLAVYAFSTAATSQNEIIASNLAREGVEIVRMMRDSNWLASDVKGGAWDRQSCADIGGAVCYPNAYRAVPPYNNYNLTAGNHRALFNLSTLTWSLDPTASYDLYTQADGTYAETPNGTAVFARMINISFNFGSGYAPDNTNSNGEMVVKSVVAWRGKNCPAFSTSQNLVALASQCKVVVEEHMTNWKDYK